MPLLFKVYGFILSGQTLYKLIEHVCASCLRGLRVLEGHEGALKYGGERAVCVVG